MYCEFEANLGLIHESLSPKRNAEPIAQRANCYILSGQDTGKIKATLVLEMLMTREAVIQGSVGVYGILSSTQNPITEVKKWEDS